MKGFVRLDDSVRGSRDDSKYPTARHVASSTRCEEFAVRHHVPFASRNADSNAVKSMVNIMVATVASRSSAIFQM